MNKAILMGRLAADPELRYTQNNVAVAKFAIAINRRFQKDQTDFINCVAWNTTAEFVSKYFGKGRMISLCGSIQTRSWDDQQTGQKRYATEVVVEEVNFCGEKQEAKPQEQKQLLNDVPPEFLTEEPVVEEDLPF